MIKKIIFFLLIFVICLINSTVSFANLQKNIIEKLALTKTLTFNFKQKIADKEEIGNCFIKYPLLMKCNYDNHKKKILISNGKTVAIIKKKYKKIYYYPLKSTPLFIILEKKKILNLLKTSKPSKIDSKIIEFEFIDGDANKLKILFDKKKLELKGWKTKDAYSNNVSFIISNVQTNNQIVDGFFRIPKENEL